MPFVLNGIHIMNPNNHGFIIAPSVPVDLVPFFTVERIFIHIRQPPFSHSHTLCIRLRSTEPESKTSLFIQSSHSCSKNCIPTPLFLFISHRPWVVICIYSHST